jgi:serine/threonine protein kinase
MEQRIFNDRYSIITKIGSGGMAEVYKAKDTVLDRTVAVKVLHQHFAEDVDFVSRFRREAQAAAGLNHPNIVNIYDWGSQNGTYFIVMEMLEGRSLKEFMTERGIIPAADAMEIAKKVLSAINFAHKHDIVHRDIKPHNIILTNDGEVKVTDFGIARAGVSTMTQTGTILGTAHYLSPEQARGYDVNGTSDIYSMGVVLYEMITGKVPFDGDNPVAIALKHVHDIPVPPRELNPGVPEALQTIIAKAMAKNPESRYQNAAEMRNDIMRAIQGMPITTVAPSEQETMVMTASAIEQPVDRAERTMVRNQTPITREPTPPPKKRRWPKVFAALIVIGMLAAGGWYANSQGLIGPKPKVIVPNVKDMSYEEAEKTLKDKKFKVKVESKLYSNTSAAGEVISQDPGPGNNAELGRVVSLVISKGQDMREVPDVTNEQDMKAVAILTKQGFELGKRTYTFSDTIDKGIVIKTQPGAGEQVPYKSTVNIEISRGPASVQIPDVIGNTKEEASSTLQTLGFQVITTEEFDENADKNKVIRTTPVGGTEITKGSQVTLVLSKGPEMITVPDVRNEPADEAKATLADLGFMLDTVTIENVSPENDGKVISQSLAAGEEVKKSTAKITIGIGRAATP